MRRPVAVSRRARQGTGFLFDGGSSRYNPGVSASTAPPAAPKRVFLSYAWEDDPYRLWVKRLASRLREDGVDARLDAWHLGENDHIAEFMNREVRQCDWVLVLCSPAYQAKVRATEDGERVAGVGWETRLLSGGILNDNQNKVLAALARGEWTEAAPDALKGQRHFDLSDGATFERHYGELLQAITGTSERAPTLGRPPSSSSAEPAEPLRGSGASRDAGRQAPRADARGGHGTRTFGWPTLIGLAVAIDVGLALFVISSLTFTATTFLQFCLMFSPVAAVVVAFLKVLTDAVRRWRVAKT